MIKLIWAQDLHGGIGKDGGLPWTCPADLNHFAKLTKGATVVMGRKTWDSLPFKMGLPGRRNIVLTRNEDFTGAEVLTPLDIIASDEDVWIMGGGEIYTLFMPYADEVHVSCMNCISECDTQAPIISSTAKLFTYSFKVD